MATRVLVEIDCDMLEKLPEGFELLRKYLRAPRNNMASPAESERELELKYHGITYLGSRHHGDRYHIQYGYGPFLSYEPKRTVW